MTGGLHPDLQDRGKFPIEMRRSRCLSFLVSHRFRICFPPSYSRTWAFFPPKGWGRNTSTMGRAAVLEPSHMTGESFLWEALALGTEL